MNLRPKRRPVPTIPIVSLIDIMVILLIFFVATTTFEKDKTQMKITLPESKTLGGAATTPEVRVAITIDEQQHVFLDGKPVELEQLAAAITAMKETAPELKLPGSTGVKGFLAFCSPGAAGMARWPVIWLRSMPSSGNSVASDSTSPEPMAVPRCS